MASAKVGSPLSYSEPPIRSFRGFANANSSLSEIKDPVRTLSRAAPIAMAFVTFVYMFVNIAYFAVVSKTDILESERIVAYVGLSHFFCLA